MQWVQLKNCELCDEEFYSQLQLKRFCSEDCRSRADHMRQVQRKREYREAQKQINRYVDQLRFKDVYNSMSPELRGLIENVK